MSDVATELRPQSEVVGPQNAAAAPIKEPTQDYRPPAPVPTTPTRALLRGFFSRGRDMLSLMPEQAYRDRVMKVGRTRRTIILVNDPEIVRRVMSDDTDDFPKNDLMSGALRPLVGDSVFVSDGEAWRRQRRMIDPAFGHIRIDRSFVAMQAAVDAYQSRLDDLAGAGATVSLEHEMSHVTADVICRTIFSRSLESEEAQEVFRSFTQFQGSVANLQLGRLLFGKAWAEVEQPPAAVESARRIRHLLGGMIDRRIEEGGPDGGPEGGDIAGDLIAAVDPVDGSRFSRDELIDQIGVFFLAGHDTTAGALAWCLFMLSQQPHIVRQMRAEIATVGGAGESIGLAQIKKMSFVRHVFREALRLYPPLAFIPRVAETGGHFLGTRFPRGAMILISPWIMQRHRALWRKPDIFDPDRFAPGREADRCDSAFLAFGQGPRVCIGAAFATIEASLILARIVRRYDIEALAPETVWPASRLTTRSVSGIPVRFRRFVDG